jgi:hypothetical protein
MLTPKKMTEKAAHNAPSAGQKADKPARAIKCEVCERPDGSPWTFKSERNLQRHLTKTKKHGYDSRKGRRFRASLFLPVIVIPFTTMAIPVITQEYSRSSTPATDTGWQNHVPSMPMDDGLELIDAWMARRQVQALM